MNAPTLALIHIKTAVLKHPQDIARFRGSVLKSLQAAFKAKGKKKRVYHTAYERLVNPQVRIAPSGSGFASAVEMPRMAP